MINIKDCENKNLSKNESFFVFTKNKNGNILKSYGPIFESEIDQVKSEIFDKENKVEILSESIYKLLYNQQYIYEFNNYWFEFIKHFLIKLNLDLLIRYDNLLENSDNLCNDFLMIDNVCCITKTQNTNLLNISFYLDLNETLSALIINELNTYCKDILDIEILSPFYINDKGIYLDGEEAESKYKYEKLFDIFLN